MNKRNSLNVLVSNRDALVAITTPLTGWAHSAEEVAEVADHAEARLDRMCMPKGKRKGVTATHVSKEPDPRTYSGSVIATTVTLRRASDGWRVIDFMSAWASSRQRGKLQLQISPAQEAAAVEAMHSTNGIVVTRAIAEVAPAAREHSDRKATT